MLHSPIAKEYGIRLYVRYRDDLYMVLSKGTLRSALSTHWSEWTARRASPYIVEKWESSLISLDWLDVTTFIDGNHLKYRPFVKPSQLGVPLLPSSQQAPAVHRSWPYAELGRLRRNSSSLYDYIVSKQQFLHRLQSYGYPMHWIRDLMHHTHRKSLRRVDANNVFCILPWHPALAGMFRFWKEYCMHPISKAFVAGLTVQPHNFPYKFGWKNPGPHLIFVLRRAM